MMWHFLTLLAVHWVADFVLQSHWMASNKSKSNRALSVHVAVCTIALCIATPLIFFNRSPAEWLGFVAVNGALHFATDYCTSRWSSRLWAKQDWHNFFVVIGLDQLIHQVTLGVTALLFFGSVS
jgi:Protein of unknown function (DUF3307)